MPVTGTSGALTYARLDAGSTAYYAEMNPANIDLNQATDISVYGPNVYITMATTNVSSNTTAPTYMTSLAINDLTNPYIIWSKTSNIVGNALTTGTLTSDQNIWLMTKNARLTSPAVSQDIWIMNANGVGNGTRFEPNNYAIYGHTIDSSNEFYYLGSSNTTYNGILTKYSSSNNNNIFSFEYISTNNAVILSDAAFETTGNIIIAGYIDFGGYANGNYLPYFGKVNSNGNNIQYSKYVETNAASVYGRFLKVIIDTSDDSLYGLLDIDGSSEPAAIIKIDNTGNLIWAKSINKTNLYDICFDSQNNIMVTGGSSITGTTYPTYEVEYVGKLSSIDGSLIWQRGLADNAQNQQYRGFSIDAKKDVYYVCGYRNFITQSARRAYYHAFPDNGTILGNGLISLPNTSPTITLKYFDISNTVTVSNANFTINTISITANTLNTSLTNISVTGSNIVNVISIEKQIR